ncbi:15729_t:CDS:2 [Cetraspora pellucida]|uniref:15729_t:CDS:1 n=1 Tax=Cetraspora pellucida TaxID=1433469 RepID=A0ACA9KJC4_9GLOM|nr:15729_t:CDS:2 [Cetraspora pellucida]
MEKEKQMPGSFPGQEAISKFKTLPAHHFCYVREVMRKRETGWELGFRELLNQINDSSKELVFIPINNPNFHWSLLVYETRSKCFYHWDTLGGANWGYGKEVVYELLRELGVPRPDKKISKNWENLHPKLDKEKKGEWEKLGFEVGLQPDEYHFAAYLRANGYHPDQDFDIEKLRKEDKSAQTYLDKKYSIDCGENQITSLTLNNLPKLSYLNASNNKLTDLTIDNCQEIAGNNHLFGSLKALQGLSELEQLFFVENQPHFRWLKEEIEKINSGLNVYDVLGNIFFNVRTGEFEGDIQGLISVLKIDKSIFEEKEKEINNLELRIQELTNLIKQQKEKIVNAYLCFASENEREQLKKLVKLHLEYTNYKKRETNAPDYGKKCRKHARECLDIQDELCDELGEEIINATQRILTDCEKLVDWEIELETKLNSKQLLLEEQKRFKIEFDNPENNYNNNREFKSGLNNYNPAAELCNNRYTFYLPPLSQDYKNVKKVLLPPRVNPDDYIRPYDIVKVNRKGGTYQHVAIYLGDRKVAHIPDTKNPPALIQKHIDIAIKAEYGKDKYNLIRNNCEHFATMCVYGVGICKQYINTTSGTLGKADYLLEATKQSDKFFEHLENRQLEQLQSYIETPPKD